MFFFPRPPRGRRARRSCAPRARLHVETLESRTTPSDLSGNTWSDPEPPDADTCAQSSDAQTFADDEFVVDTTTSGDQYNSCVEVNGDGSLVLWSTYGPGGTVDVSWEPNLVESSEIVDGLDNSLQQEAETQVQ
jgi:hypothetical protein